MRKTGPRSGQQASDAELNGKNRPPDNGEQPADDTGLPQAEPAANESAQAEPAPDDVSPYGDGWVSV